MMLVLYQHIGQQTLHEVGRIQEYTKLDSKLDSMTTATETDCAAQVSLYTGHLPNAYN